jgi:hypothetical protein
MSDGRPYSPETGAPPPEEVLSPEEQQETPESPVEPRDGQEPERLLPPVSGGAVDTAEIAPTVVEPAVKPMAPQPPRKVEEESDLARRIREAAKKSPEELQAIAERNRQFEEQRKAAQRERFLASPQGKRIQEADTFIRQIERQAGPGALRYFLEQGQDKGFIQIAGNDYHGPSFFFEGKRYAPVDRTAFAGQVFDELKAMAGKVDQPRQRPEDDAFLPARAEQTKNISRRDEAARRQRQLARSVADRVGKYRTGKTTDEQATQLAIQSIQNKEKKKGSKGKREKK